MAKARGLGKALIQSLSPPITSDAISSGMAGRPGTAYPSPNHFDRSRSRQRVEQNGVCSSERGFLQIGQVRSLLVMTDDLGSGRFDGKARIGLYPHLAPRALF